MKLRSLILLSLSLAVALGLTALWSAGRAQRALAEKMVRLHVVASSDREEDQAVKLLVRDAVLEETEPLLQHCRSRREAEETLRSALSRLTRRAEDVLAENGFAADASAELSLEQYPTRTYETFSLPAGEYLSLRVKLGEGQGKNWWCVVFPPLCTAAASEEFDTAADMAALTGDEIRLITGESGDVVLRFKLLEWINGWIG